MDTIIPRFGRIPTLDMARAAYLYDRGRDIITNFSPDQIDQIRRLQEPLRLETRTKEKELSRRVSQYSYHGDIGCQQDFEELTRVLRENIGNAYLHNDPDSLGNALYILRSCIEQREQWPSQVLRETGRMRTMTGQSDPAHQAVIDKIKLLKQALLQLFNEQYLIHDVSYNNRTRLFKITFFDRTHVPGQGKYYWSFRTWLIGDRLYEDRMYDLDQIDIPNFTPPLPNLRFPYEFPDEPDPAAGAALGHGAAPGHGAESAVAAYPVSEPGDSGDVEMNGGAKNDYYQKYIKYKTKYMNLKNRN
jgi:hypothetical protein